MTVTSAAAPYGVGDLQEIDERCQAIAGELGFELPEIVYHLMRSTEIYDIAARGLPGRYSSSRFGASYRKQLDDYRLGRSRIYELIVNTDPVHAYLLDGNSLTAQTLVIAHCLGHAWFFHNNGWFEPTDGSILSRVAGAAERIDGYMGEYGRDRVEDVIDAAEAIAIHQPQAQLIRRSAPEEEHYQPTPYDRLFPDEVAAERKRIEQEGDARRERFPAEPEGELLGFIERHARGLEDWERDVISIVRFEQAYFLPQLRTKILNEGIAVLCHQEIVQRLYLPTDHYWEYEALNAGVVRPGGLQVNPYHVGITILREIMRICEEPDEEEAERWPWAGSADPLEQVRTICRSYDDEALLREFLTPKVCEKAQLFAYEHVQSDPRRIRISSREHEEVRELLVRQHSRFGIPSMHVVDADYRGRGELYLEHPDDEQGLDPEYARGTLTQIARVWGRSAVARTVRKDKPVWYIGRPDGSSEQRSSAP